MRKPRRFWSKVDVGEAGECWEWLASKTGGGYGSFGIHGRIWYAHRVVWTLTYGPIPKGLLVCHHCDNPGCVNPYHLFLGTDKDNAVDSARKGRRAWKLTKRDVREIREMLEKGYLHREIAVKFDVSRALIGSIRNGKRWSWLGKKGEI